MWTWVSRWKLPLGMILSMGIGFAAALLMVAAGWFDPKPQPPAHEWGEFLSKPKVELMDDGRKLVLLEEFVYLDPRKKIWVAPKRSVVDGASIPRVFWTIVGGPLEGQYRYASIVHDVECVRRMEPWEDVHFMFYEACRCGGLPENKAKLVYAAVYHFGPRWEVKVKEEVKQWTGPDGKPRFLTVHVNTPELIKPTEEPGPEVREKLEKIINEQNPSLEELKKLDPKGL